MVEYKKNELECGHIFHKMWSYFPCGFKSLLFTIFAIMNDNNLPYFYGALIGCIK